MGREIRRVPANWKHPKYENFYKDMSPNDRVYGRYHPMYNEDYNEASQEWMKNLTLWQERKHPEQLSDPERWVGDYFWNWQGNPPEEPYYRSEAYGTKFRSEATHYQIYETVSEGTPVSPIFETLGLMTKWLRSEGYSPEAANQFVKDGHAFSIVISDGVRYKDIESTVVP